MGTFMSWFDFFFLCVETFLFMVFLLIIFAIVEDRKRSKRDKKKSKTDF